MTANTPPRSRGARRGAGVCQETSAPQRGRGDCRAPSAPAGSCAWVVVEWHTSRTGPPESPGIPARNGLRLLRALPGDRAFLSPSSAEIASRELDASVEASGPHDLAVRFKRPRQKRHPRPPQTRPASVTTAIRPFWWDGMAANIAVIWIRKNRNIFFSEGMTRGSKNRAGDLPVG